MKFTLRARSRAALVGAVAVSASLLVAGCDHTTTDPSSTLPAQFATQATLPDIQNGLGSVPRRVEVAVIPGTLTARRVELEEPNAVSRREEIRSRVTAVTAGTDTATLTLELGGLEIAVNGSTRLRPDDGDEHPSELTLASFVTRIKNDIAAGRNPGVRAVREPPAQPQGPADGSFLAGGLQLDEGSGHPLIELNIAAANLVTNPTPPPDAFLKVLGLSIALRVSDGTTKLRIENPHLEGVQEFHGLVKSVDQTAQTVTLKDGTVIRIVAGTEIEASEGDEDNHLTSLAAVQSALSAGQTVKAEGRGLLESTNPTTFDAIRIEFEVVEEQLPPAATMVEFHETVASVDVAHQTFTLGHGAVVTVTSQTMIDPEGLTTLQAVADSLAAHKTVHAEGVATVTSAGPPPAWTALFVEFETHRPSEGP